MMHPLPLQMRVILLRESCHRLPPFLRSLYRLAFAVFMHLVLSYGKIFAGSASRASRWKSILRASAPTSSSMASSGGDSAMSVLPVALTSEVLPGVALGAPAAVSLVNDSDDEDELLGYDAAGDINEAVPRDSTEAVPLPAARPVTDTIRASWIRSEVCRLWGQPRLLQTCPGPNPVCVERKHLAWIRDGEYEYVVAEKTDGVRYLLCCCRASDLRDESSIEQEAAELRTGSGAPSAGAGGSAASRNVAFMVDRAFDAYEVHLRNAPEDIYEGTLLDGELVREESGEVKFLVYDCVALYGHHVGNVEDYVARLNVLSSLFYMDTLPAGSPPPLLSARPLSADGAAIYVAAAADDAPGGGADTEAKSVASSCLHYRFKVLLKPVFAACHVAHVMHMAGFPEAPLAEGEDAPRRFPHQSDGIILTPRNLEVVTGTNWPMLKWKGENNPIDLLLEASIGDNAQEWADYANPIMSAKRRAGRTLRSIVDSLRVSQTTRHARPERGCGGGAGSGRRSAAESSSAKRRDGRQDSGRNASRRQGSSHSPGGRGREETAHEGDQEPTPATANQNKWSMAAGVVCEAGGEGADEPVREPSPSRTRSRSTRREEGAAAYSGLAKQVGAVRGEGIAPGAVASITTRQQGVTSKQTVGLGRGVVVRALVVNGGTKQKVDGAARKRGRGESRRESRSNKARTTRGGRSRSGSRSRSRSSRSSSSSSSSGSSSSSSRSGDRRRRRSTGRRSSHDARGDARRRKHSSSAERRAEARRLRQEKKERALKAAVQLHKEARRIQKRAQLRFAMLAQSAALPSDASSSDAAAHDSGISSDILDQPESIHWRLRLLYREGRSFKDAASGFPYSGYTIRFSLENSPMLRAVLAGFEALVREQYLHVRRARLADHRARGGGSGSASSGGGAANVDLCRVPANGGDVPSVRAVGVVVECDTKLNLEKQLMRCRVVRARQDKLDPNCRLTITRTLGAIIDPVSASDLVQALRDAPVVTRCTDTGGAL